MKRRAKRNMVFTIVGVVGILLIAFFLFSKGKDRLFERYANKEKGFSIKYPKEWTVVENKNGAAVLFYSPKENELDYFQESVNIVVQDISDDPMNISDYSEKAIDQLDAVYEENLTILESGPMFTQGRTAYKMEFIVGGVEPKAKYLSVWTLKDNKAFQVTYMALRVTI